MSITAIGACDDLLLVRRYRPKSENLRAAQRCLPVFLAAAAEKRRRRLQKLAPGWLASSFGPSFPFVAFRQGFSLRSVEAKGA